MKKFVLSQKPKKNYLEESFNRNKFIEFVADQFRQLSKKKIRVPITLYHL